MGKRWAAGAIGCCDEVVTAREVAAFFPGGKWRGETYETHCSAHSDRHPSLGISPAKNGGVVIHCQAGCDPADVLAAVGLSLKDLAPPPVNGSRPLEPESVYRYDDERGEPLYEKVRLPGKQFFLRLPGGNGGGIGDVRRVLFGLPELLATKPGETVAIVEGEKDALNVRKRGVAATTNPEGAAKAGQRPKWRAEYTEWLKTNLGDRRFAVFADQDEAGLAHAEAVVASLKAAGLVVVAVNLGGLAAKEDVSDWLSRHSDEEFRALLAPRLRFPLITIEQMLDLPPPVWQVDTLWEEGGVVMVFGEGGSGKTFLVLDICMHVIREMVWHGRDVRGGPVVYINADGGIPFRQRPQAWIFDRPTDPPLFPFLIYNDRIDVRERGRFAEFVSELDERAQKPVAIIIDTFHRCMPGADENDAKDTSLFFDALGVARRELGATTLFVHHSNRADTGHRGHSSLRDDADTAIEVRRDPSGLRRVRCDKQKNGVEFPDFYFDLRPVLDSCVIEMSAAPEEDGEQSSARRRGPDEEGQIQAALRHVIAAGSITQAELAAVMDRSQPRVSYYCRTLRQRGLITIRRGLIDNEGRRPDIYEPRPELRKDRV